MFAKIVRGNDLNALEKAVNDFIAESSLEKVDPTEHHNLNRRLKVYNVQQFVIGEVDPKNVALINRQPVPTYSFCLLLICGYE